MDMLDESRLRNKALFSRVVTPDEAALLIQNHDRVGFSGFTPSGYPKKTSMALAQQIKNGRKVKISIWSGASVGPEIEESLASVHGVEQRVPYYSAGNKSMKEEINDGEIKYIDLHLSEFAQQVKAGFFGPVDVAVVEALAITKEGNLILGTGVGNTPTFVRMAKRVIVEVNKWIPLELEGIHDIYEPNLPPNRREFPVYHPGDRIGTTYVPCGLEKIAAIVESDIPDHVRPLGMPTLTTQKIADNLIDFLEMEQKKGRMPSPLLPMQSGVGKIANAVLMGMRKSRFQHLQLYSEILQDAVFDLIEEGKVDMASGCAFTPSPGVMEMYRKNPTLFNSHLVLRPLEISNNPGVIRRLGVISLNVPVEFDIYGQANSTHVMGRRMVNGIGGSGDYMRNGYLTIFTAESTTAHGNISRVIPMCSHVDHTEHDTMVFITEQGIADLRGLDPRERAREIITHCAHPDYRPLLMEYLLKAEQYGGHMPVDLEEAFSMHRRFEQTGSMKKEAGPYHDNTKKTA
ncbi:succinate CoA transferase [Dialister sp.]|uniref:succinate CoA transferase n=1 Tax=Dialister sp. TaxID=1955814 RepID=UPI003EFFE9A4